MANELKREIEFPVMLGAKQSVSSGGLFRPVLPMIKLPPPRMN